MAATGRVYLDYNASAPLLAEAREAVGEALALTGNPSSVHGEGRALRSLIEQAREDVAALVNANPAEVVFTSGATESNVTVLAAGWDAVAMAGIEHDSVLAPVRASAARVIDLAVGADGVVSLAGLAEALASAAGAGRGVVALQMANNETGVLQPVADVAAIAREHGLKVHTDAVQAAGRVEIDFAALGADTMALSAHKMGGPKGVGALVVRDGVELAALIRGGGQERRRRAGTENAGGIAGFGAAARVARERLSELTRVAGMRDRLEALLLAATPGAVIFGAGAARIGNTTCIGVAGRASEITVIKLDVAGFAVSAGAACSSGRVAMSHVLAGMGVEPQAARGAIRISIGFETTAADIDAFAAAWQASHASVPVVPGRAQPKLEIRGRTFETVSAIGE